MIVALLPLIDSFLSCHGHQSGWRSQVM